MIQKEFYKIRKDGVNLIRIYSDNNMKIEREGETYIDAIEEENSTRQYTETDKPIEFDEATEQDYIEALERLGVITDEEE